MQESFVDTPESLVALCETLRGSEWLAIDTEFIREKTYYPRLCLIQVCNGEVAAAIDPIRLKNIQPFLDIFPGDPFKNTGPFTVEFNAHLRLLKLVELNPGVCQKAAVQKYAFFYKKGDFGRT